MARINIEDQWWTDPRRAALVRLGVDADGLALRAWRLAQDFWKHGRALVPKQLFDTLDGATQLVQVGLADVRESFVYVRGSSAYLDWIHEKREQAKAAGRKSAQARRAKSGSAQPKRTKSGKSAERTPNEPRTESNDAEPSLSLSSSLSSSFSESSKLQKIEKSKGEAGEGGAAREFIATYCELWKMRYGTNPEMGGAPSGIAKRIVKNVGAKRASELVTAYLRMNNSWFVQKRHDLFTLERDLQAVVIFADTGGNVTQGELRQADKTQTNQNVWDSLKTPEGGSQ